MLVIFERQSPNALPVFQKMYVCLTVVREGFIVVCSWFIGIDGCILKGLMKCQLLVAMGRDRNSQMFPTAWAIVKKETAKIWT